MGLVDHVSCPVCRALPDASCSRPRADERGRRPHLRRVLVALAGWLLARVLPAHDRLLVAQAMTQITPRRDQQAHQDGLALVDDDAEEYYTYEVLQNLLRLVRDAVTALDGVTLDLDPLAERLRQVEDDIEKVSKATALCHDGITCPEDGERAYGFPTAEQVMAWSELIRLNECVRAPAARRDADSIARWPADSSVASWDVDWRDNGCFDAIRRPAGLPLSGWAPTPETVPDALRRWSTPPTTPVTVAWLRPPTRPRRQLPAGGWDGSDTPGLSADPHQIWQRNEDELLAMFADAQADLKRRWSTEDLDQALAAAAERLNAEEPQAPSILNALLADPSEISTRTLAVGWVKPTRVVATGRRWNAFASHRPKTVPYFARNLIAENAPDAARAFCIPPGDPIELFRVPGPAGPLYELGSNGTHRIHTARLLGFPLIWAKITQDTLPYVLSWSGVYGPDEVNGRDRIAAAAARWRGLIRRGLIAGEIDDSSPAWPNLLLVWAAAPWLPLSPERVVAWNSNYERVYPRALSRAGIPENAWTAPQTWHDWLTND